MGTNPNDLHEYSKHLLRQWAATGKTDALLAQRMGCSQGFLSQIKVDRTHMGLPMLAALGGVFGWTLSEYINKAEEWVRQGAPGSKVERPERYPNRANAIAFARSSGISENAINVVATMDLNSEVDPTPIEWLRLLEDAERRARYQPRGGRGSAAEERARAAALLAEDMPTASKRPKAKPAAKKKPAAK